jgi:hypothetical protein
MRNIMMKTIGKVCFFGFAMMLPALAQNLVQTTPAPAVAGPSFDMSVGYTYLTMPVPSAGRTGLNGLDFSGTVGLGPRWGAMLDSNFARTSDVFSTRHQAYVLGVHTGPVFYPVEHGNTRVLVRALVGAGLVDGAVPIEGTENYHGWLFRPSYLVGTGVEHAVSSQLGVRVNADYVRTDFYDSAGAQRPQNDLRLTVSFVFRLKEHQPRPSTQLW